MNIRLFFATLMIAFVLSGCAANLSKPTLDEAKLLVSKEGLGNLYVMRKGAFIGLGTPATVVVDGKELGTLWNDRYLVTSLSPGKHTINIKWLFRVDQVNLTVGAGENSFVETGWSGASGCANPTALCVGTRSGIATTKRAMELLAEMKDINAL